METTIYSSFWITLLFIIKLYKMISLFCFFFLLHRKMVAACWLPSSNCVFTFSQWSLLVWHKIIKLEYQWKLKPFQSIRFCTIFLLSTKNWFLNLPVIFSSKSQCLPSWRCIRLKKIFKKKNSRTFRCLPTWQCWISVFRSARNMNPVCIILNKFKTFGQWQW